VGEGCEGGGIDHKVVNLVEEELGGLEKCFGLRVEMRKVWCIDAFCYPRTV
jgi:hypothetical protein